MKKSISLLIVLSCFIIAGRAQSTTYHAITADVDVGVGDKFTFTFEPHYRAWDNLALGARFQDAASVTLDFTTEGANNKTSSQTFSSACLTADYYFLNSRPGHKLALFAGGGFGGFTQSVSNVTTSTSADNFGYFPRIGFQTGRFRGSIEYNVTGGTNNYVSVNAGLFFGGGKK